MIRQLGPVTPAAELARQLNAAGIVTGNSRPFDAKAVQWIRHAYHIPAPAPHHDGEISVAEAARRLGCSTGVIYYWIQWSIPGSSTRGAARETGYASPGTTRSRPPAATASPHPDTSTPQPGAPHPAAAEPARKCRHQLPCSCQQIRQHNLTSTNPEHSDTCLQEGQYEATVAMPSGRSRPSAFGMYARRDGRAR
jgi:hypothetical protein